MHVQFALASSGVTTPMHAFNKPLSWCMQQQSLKDPRGGTMLCVIRRTLLLCAAFYTTVAMSGGCSAKLMFLLGGCPGSGVLLCLSAALMSPTRDP